MKATILVTSAVIAISAGAAGQTPPQSLAVPAYFPLATNPNDWMRIQRAGRIAKIVVVDDTIGTTGTGTGCTSSPTAMFDCLRANTQFVLGYVLTNSGKRRPPAPADPLTYVLHGGDNLLSVDQWYGNYNGHIDGIFLDVGPSFDDPKHLPESDQQSYYRSLYQMIAANHSGPCGGHACVMINASQFPNNWVMSTTQGLQIADYVVLYERPLHGGDMVHCPPNFVADAQDYMPASPPPPPATTFCPSGTSSPSCSATQVPSNWYFDPANAARSAHILFSSHDANDINAIIAKSRSSYGSPAFLYVHDQDCDATHGAVYGRLPPYFEQLVAALDASSLQVILVTDPATGARVPVVLSF